MWLTILLFHFPTNSHCFCFPSASSFFRKPVYQRIMLCYTYLQKKSFSCTFYHMPYVIIVFDAVDTFLWATCLSAYVYLWLGLLLIACYSWGAVMLMTGLPFRCGSCHLPYCSESYTVFFILINIEFWLPALVESQSACYAPGLS